MEYAVIDLPVVANATTDTPDVVNKCLDKCQVVSSSPQSFSEDDAIVFREALNYLSKTEPLLAATLAEIVRAVLARVLLSHASDICEFARCSSWIKRCYQNAKPERHSGGDKKERALELTSFQDNESDSRVARARRIALDEYPSALLTASRVSRRIGISVSHFGRLFTCNCGCAYSAFVKLVRVRSGVLMLAHSDLRVQEIAGLVGYSHASSFNRDLAEIAGLTPREIRAAARHSVQSVIAAKVLPSHATGAAVRAMGFE